TYDLVIATHLLEHIHLDRFENAVDNIAARSHNLLIVSVPHKYPYHARPIDNLWRPTAHEIMHKFRHNFDAIYAQTFETEHTDPKFAHTSKCSVSYCLLQRITN
ncbi:MAG TPA: hypothetical protein VK158_05565, partial [Acidobacteriota bacterium]|nr:hypothetical protein [Acidobacteriota bacterium]